MTVQLHRTYQPDIFYTAFSNLPKAAQEALRAAEPEVECSRYTCREHAGFIRAEVEVDGALYAAEISLGRLEPEAWRPEDDPDNSDNDDEYAESILNELVACSELEHADVYLTWLEDSAEPEPTIVERSPSSPDVDCSLVADMLAAYIECALWSSTDESDESGGVPMDKNYGPDDIDEKTLAEMEDDCSNFLAYVAEVSPEAHAELVAEPGRAGHDFWLTRNGHGAGFWDGDWEHGDELTKAVKTFGSVDLCVGDDGKIYA